MKIVLIFLFLIIAMGVSHAGTLANIYILYPSSVTNLEVTALKAVDPENTVVLPAANTNYFILQITTKTDIENTNLLLHISRGNLKKIGEQELMSQFDSHFGGVVEWVRKSYVTNIPVEFKERWKVERTTP